MSEPKPAKASKTLWLNAISLALIAGIATAELMLPSVKELMSPFVYAGIAIGLAVANAFLRFITSQPIK